MLDLNFVRDNLELVKQKMRERGLAEALGGFENADRLRRANLKSLEEIRAKKNKATAEIANLKRTKRDAEADVLRRELREMDSGIRTLEEHVKEYEGQLRDMLLNIPNIPHSSVPVGHGSEDNQEVRRWGQPRQFDFSPQAHWDLGPALGILDFERATKITGARFAVYAGVGARLERALANFMLDMHTREHGYTEILPPFLVNSASLFGTGQLPKFKEDLFKLEVRTIG